MSDYSQDQEYLGKIETIVAEQSDGIKAQDIANLLRVPKQFVNRILYDNLDKFCKIGKFKWYLKANINNNEDGSNMVEPDVHSSNIEKFAANYKLSQTAVRNIINAGYNLDEIMNLTLKDLVKIKFIGPKTARELIYKLHKDEEIARSTLRGVLKNKLLTSGIYNFAQIEHLNKTEISRIKGFGIKYVDELYMYLLDTNYEDRFFNVPQKKSLKESISELDDNSYVDSVCKNYPNSRELLLRRAKGETLESIGIDLGITRERVRQKENKYIIHLAKLGRIRELIIKCDPEIYIDRLSNLSEDNYMLLWYLIKSRRINPKLGACRIEEKYYIASIDYFKGIADEIVEEHLGDITHYKGLDRTEYMLLWNLINNNHLNDELCAYRIEGNYYILPKTMFNWIEAWVKMLGKNKRTITKRVLIKKSFYGPFLCNYLNKKHFSIIDNETKVKKIVENPKEEEIAAQHRSKKNEHIMVDQNRAFSKEEFLYLMKANEFDSCKSLIKYKDFIINNNIANIEYNIKLLNNNIIDVRFKKGRKTAIAKVCVSNHIEREDIIKELSELNNNYDINAQLAYCFWIDNYGATFDAIELLLEQ